MNIDVASDGAAHSSVFWFVARPAGRGWRKRHLGWLLAAVERVNRDGISLLDERGRP